MKTEFKIEFDREVDARWIAEIHALPGVLAYGATRQEARSKAEALAMRVTTERVLPAPSLQR